ncbi:MAG: hypothetical protein J1E38_07425 [Paramuribaculum sp.]|nr:hypothetical protein [Paramuribaculum sp.]
MKPFKLLAISLLSLFGLASCSEDDGFDIMDYVVDWSIESDGQLQVDINKVAANQLDVTVPVNQTGEAIFHANNFTEFYEGLIRVYDENHEIIDIQGQNLSSGEMTYSCDWIDITVLGNTVTCNYKSSDVDQQIKYIDIMIQNLFIKYGFNYCNSVISLSAPGLEGQGIVVSPLDSFM